MPLNMRFRFSPTKDGLVKVLGPLETDIMQIIWQDERSTVKKVHRKLSQQRDIAYTTVMTTLGRLADKGLVRRVEDQPAHRYSALVSRDEYARSTVKSVVDWLVTRFPDPAVAYFLDRVEEEDDRVIEKLRQAIDQRRDQGAGD